jgi:nucleoside-diphosphate-sugar epimerase
MTVLLLGGSGYVGTAIRHYLDRRGVTYLTVSRR